jgi:DNA-binding response OmpR family regulator
MTDAAGRGGRSVLLVEDEDSVRLSLRDFLKRAGFDVMVASDGVGAIKLLLDHAFAVIITDYRMEVLGGDYWIRFLRRFCAGTAVIITTGFLRPDIEIPFEVFYKPFEYADLAARIEALTVGRAAPPAALD